MGKRSRRKVDAVIGVALVLGLIGSEMRPDGGIGGKLPSVLERNDVDMGVFSDTTIDQSLVEELGRIKGASLLGDENNSNGCEKGVILPVLPLPVPKATVRPDHCYSSFSGKEVKQEPSMLWTLPPSATETNQVPVQAYPLTADVQYMPSALEMLHQRMGVGEALPRDLNAELADLLASVRPAPGEQSPLITFPASGNPEDLLNDILAENGQLAFDEPSFSPKSDVNFLDPHQDIFKWMEQGALDADGASSSQAPDLFGGAVGGFTEKSLSPVVDTDRTIEELLHALEREEKSVPFAQTFDPFFTDVPCTPSAVVPESARKRKSEPSWSAASSSSSSSCKSGFEPIVRDYHNHTYDESAAERRGKKAARTRSSNSDDSSSNSGVIRCRDVVDFENMGIPYSYENVISAEPNIFNNMVSDQRLNDEQRNLMRAARRRAKNRNAARQCRQRRVDEVGELADEVEGLEDERNNAVAEMDAIDNEIAAQRAANERLQAFIIEAYAQQRPPAMSDAEYRLQSNPRNGSFTLVEQRGIRA